jgi:basic membrane protein A
MIKRTDVAVETVMQDYADGAFPGGETINLGLEQDGVGLSDFSNTREDIPQEYLDRIDDMTQQIIAGDIEVWNVIEQGYPDFYEGS